MFPKEFADSRLRKLKRYASCALARVVGILLFAGRFDLTMMDYYCGECGSVQSGNDPGVYITSQTFPGQCTPGKASYVFAVEALEAQRKTRLLQPRSSRSGQLNVLNAIGIMNGRPVCAC